MAFSLTFLFSLEINNTIDLSLLLSISSYTISYNKDITLPFIVILLLILIKLFILALFILFNNSSNNALIPFSL